MLSIVLGAAIHPACFLMDLNYVVALYGDLTAVPNSLRGRENKKEIEGSSVLWKRYI